MTSAHRQYQNRRQFAKVCRCPVCGQERYARNGVFDEHVINPRTLTASAEPPPLCAGSGQNAATAREFVELYKGQVGEL